MFVTIERLVFILTLVYAVKYLCLKSYILSYILSLFKEYFTKIAIHFFLSIQHWYSYIFMLFKNKTFSVYYCTPVYSLFCLFGMLQQSELPLWQDSFKLSVKKS